MKFPKTKSENEKTKDQCAFFSTAIPFPGLGFCWDKMPRQSGKDTGVRILGPPSRLSSASHYLCDLR